MDTSSSKRFSFPLLPEDMGFDVYLADLHGYGARSDETAMMKAAEGVLRQALRHLKAVLKYVAVSYELLSKNGHTADPPGMRLMDIGLVVNADSPDIGRRVFLNDKSEWFTALPWNDGGQHARAIADLQPSDDVWRYMPFAEIFRTLSGIFDEALLKKTRHLESLRERTMTLRSINETLSRVVGRLPHK